MSVQAAVQGVEHTINGFGFVQALSDVIRESQTVFALVLCIHQWSLDRRQHDWIGTH